LLAFPVGGGTIRGMQQQWIEQLNLIDLACAIFLLFGIIRGYLRGLSGELARVISMVVVLFLGWQFYAPLGAKLMEITRLDEHESQLAGFLSILVGAGIVMVFLRWILKNLMDFTFKGPLEKVGGMAAGFVRTGIWVTMVVVAATLSPSDYLNRKFSEESQIGSLVIQYLVPAYQRLAVEHPDLGLPTIPDVEVPAVEPDRNADAGSDKTPDGTAEE